MKQLLQPIAAFVYCNRRVPRETERARELRHIWQTVELHPTANTHTS